MMLGLTCFQVAQRSGLREAVIAYHERRSGPARSSGQATLTTICAVLRNEARAQRKALAGFTREALCPDVWQKGSR
jgi:hypothetical protein